MGQFQAKLCAGMLSPMDGEVGHGIGNMSLMQIDYSTRIGSLNKHSTKSASCQLYKKHNICQNTTNHLLVGKHMKTNI